MKKSESIVEISKALTKFHQEVEQPTKDKVNPHFKSKYVPLENVVKAINDVAPKHGLSFMQWPLNDANGRVGMATIVMHDSGEYIEFDPVFMTADKNTAQGAGSLITYLKRYTLSAIFGITSDEDDDGHGASQKPPQQPQGNDKQPPDGQQVGQMKTLIASVSNLNGVSGAQVVEQLQQTLNFNIDTNNWNSINAQQASQVIAQLQHWESLANK